MKSIELRIQTRTPIATGGSDGKSDRLHATGVLGSLRWWYEAILRGYGRRACDPSQHTCLVNPKDPREPKDQLCYACKIFGATGYARRFQLEVIAEDEKAWEPDRQPINFRPYGRTRGWYISAGRIGAARLRLTGEDEPVDRMLALLKFLERHASLGARPQLGLGVFAIQETQDARTGNHISTAPAFPERRGDNPISELPDLRAFTFFKFRFRPQRQTWWTQVPGIRELRTRPEEWAAVQAQAERHAAVPVSPALKNWIRFNCGYRWPRDIEDWLFGAVRGNDRRRSKVAFSWAYQDGADWEVRGWLYLPHDREGRAFYQYAPNLTALKTALEDPQQWLRALNLDPHQQGAVALTLTPQPAFQPHTAADVEELFK